MWRGSVLVLLAGALSAQDGAKPKVESDVQKLDRLLRELGDIPAAVWEQRRQRIARRLEERKQHAIELRQRAQALLAQAKGVDGEVAALGTELKRVAELRSLVAGTMAASTPAAQPKPSTESKRQPKAKALAPKAEVGAASAKPELPNDLVDWQTHVRPIFENNCTLCHDDTDREGGLDLTSYGGVVEGGGSGKTLVKGQPDQSRLFLLVSHRERPTMPPDEPRIEAASIETIRRWIAHGAPEDREAAVELFRRREAERKAAEERARKTEAERAEAAAAAPLPTAVPDLERSIGVRAAAMRAVAASPLAPVLAVAGRGQVLLQHAADLRPLATLPFEPGQLQDLRFSRDGSLMLASGGTPARSGGAVLFDVETGKELGRFGESSDSMFAAAISPDADYVAVGGANQRVEVYAARGELLYEVPHDDWVLALDISADGKLLASADRKGNILVTELRTGRSAHRLDGHDGKVHALRFRPDSSLLASAGEDATVRCWRMRDGRQAWSKRGHPGGALCLAWKDAALLASGGADGRVRLWKADGNGGGKTIGIGEWVYGIAFGSDGQRLYTGDWRGWLSAVDWKAGKPLARAVPTAPSS